MRPLVVSDHAVLREYYGDAAVYVESTAESIAAGIGAALDDSDEYRRRLEELAATRRTEWDAAAAELGRRVGRTV